MEQLPSAQFNIVLLHLDYKDVVCMLQVSKTIRVHVLATTVGGTCLYNYVRVRVCVRA